MSAVPPLRRRKEHPLAGKSRAGASVKPAPSPLAADSVPVPSSGPAPAATITLAQFLKLHHFADSGGAAKHLVRSGGIQVNGVDEDRPGRQLAAGDKVVIQGRELVVAL